IPAVSAASRFRSAAGSSPPATPTGRWSRTGPTARRCHTTMPWPSCSLEAARSSTPQSSKRFLRCWPRFPPRLASMTSPELACLDGRTAPVAETAISVTDEGFLRGDGVFEVIRVYVGRPFALAEHLDRIERSAANLRLGRDVPRAEFEREIPGLVDER